MSEELIKVLLIEDDEEDYLLTREVFEDMSNRRYILNWVPSYEEGVKEILLNKHDVYLVDYRLGKETGLSLIHTAITRDINRPFILLTGQDDRDVDLEAMTLGAADFLVKDKLNATNLDRAIRYALKLTQTLNELRNSQQRLREAQVLAQVGHFDWNPVANTIFWSDEHYRIFGLEPQAFPIDCDTFLKFIIPEDLPHLKQSINFLHQAEEYGELDYKIRLSGGAIRHLQTRATAKRDASGKLLTISGTTQDTTEQIEKNKRLQEKELALKKEKELSVLKSRFISMASHEFRTPLTTILASVDLIQVYNQKGNFEKQKKHIQRIKSSVSNLTSILQDFLSIEKLESGKIDVKSTEVALPKFIEGLIEEIELMGQQGQKIYHAHSGEGAVRIDQHLVKNILINLLSNAIKYSPAGENVEIRTFHQGQRLCIEVEDKGIGIPEEEQEQLFSRFFRATNALNIKGTGLGLTIVKRYLELMGGEISFVSKANQGTTFTVVIPQ